jgi:hypothetical protein
MTKDIGTVGGLVEYLKTLPQDAAVYVADGESYRFVEDYPDWDVRDNASFPIESVAMRDGRTAEQQSTDYLERWDERSTHLSPAQKAASRTAMEEIAEFAVDEPAQIVTLVGCR